MISVGIMLPPVACVSMYFFVRKLLVVRSTFKFVGGLNWGQLTSRLLSIRALIETVVNAWTELSQTWVLILTPLLINYVGWAMLPDLSETHFFSHL